MTRDSYKDDREEMRGEEMRGEEMRGEEKRREEMRGEEKMKQEKDGKKQLIVVGTTNTNKSLLSLSSSLREMNGRKDERSEKEEGRKKERRNIYIQGVKMKNSFFHWMQ